MLRNKNGFSLLELMIVVCVIGILLAVATPNITQWYYGHRLSSVAGEIRLTLQAAKLNAMKLNEQVVVEYDPAANTFTAFVDNGNCETVFNPITNTFNPWVNAANNCVAANRQNGIRDGFERVISSINIPPHADLYALPIFNGGVNLGLSTQFNPMGFPVGFNGGPLQYDGDIYLRTATEPVRYRRVRLGVSGFINIEKGLGPTPGDIWFE